MERLQKIISAAGVASRRKAEELITSGLVQVNGQTVTELGTKADAAKDHIRVNGKLLKFSGHHVYILLNKPKGYVTTLSDPEGRPTIVDLLRGVKARVYPVGRLDYASEGLLLLTNDGELANALTKAASHVPKTYLVKISGQPSDAAIEQLRTGIALPDRKGISSRTAPAGIKLVHKAENPWYEVTLIEGRNRQVRAMFEQTGHHVEKLKRVRYGPFTLDVHPGEFRNLLPEEVTQLRAAIHRGSSATAETAVRPADQCVSHIETELREEAAVPTKLPIAPARTLPGKPKRTPKPLGTFASDVRNGSTRPERARPDGFRGNDFRKKGPHKAKFRRDRAQERASFQFPANENSPRPVSSAGSNQRPVWNKAARPGAPGASAPRKWTQGASSPTSRPRTFEKSSPRPVRSSSTNQQSGWGKSGSPRIAAPGVGIPKKWTKAAPSPVVGPRTAGPRTFDRQKPMKFRPRTAQPGKPRREAVRGDARKSRPSDPSVRQGRDAKPPFWQGADKRRPRKPKEEGDSEQRPAAHAKRPDSRKPGSRKYGAAKFSKNRPR